MIVSHFAHSVASKVVLYSELAQLANDKADEADCQLPNGLSEGQLVRAEMSQQNKQCKVDTVVSQLHMCTK